MLIRDWMTIPAPSIDPYTKIDEAKHIMIKLNHRTLAVVEGGKLLGVITRRDILKFDPASRTRTNVFFSEKKIENKIVEQIMTRDVVVIMEDSSLKNAAAVMIKNKFNALPVVDESGQLTGMLTTPNLFAFIFKNSNRQEFSISAKQFMSKNILFLSPNDTLNDAKDIMTEEFIRSIPILKNGDLIGIVTRTDLLSVNPSLFSQNPNDLSTHSINETPLGYIMTSKPITINKETLVPDIARKMLNYQIHSLPVLDHENKLVGIITETDLFQLIVEKANFSGT